VQTRAGRHAIVVPVQRKQPVTTTQRALRQFADAVLAFSDDPGPANLERYLAASSALEESRRARPNGARRAA